jgi:DNA-binding response OmpR family regulator
MITVSHPNPAAPPRLLPAEARRTKLVLVADPHQDTRQMLRTLLTLEGFAVVEADTGESAWLAASRLLPDVMLIDSALDRFSALRLVQELRSADEDVTGRLVVTSGRGDAAVRSAFEDAGCHTVLVKPVDVTDLVSRIRLKAEAPRGPA